MSELERIDVESKLLGLSRKYPQILMVPGTVFYRKQLVRAPGFDLKFDPATGQRTLAKTSPNDRRARAIQKTRAYIVKIPGQRTPADWDLLTGTEPDTMRASTQCPRCGTSEPP